MSPNVAGLGLNRCEKYTWVGMTTETLSMVDVTKGCICAFDELKMDLWVLCFLGGITVLVE